MTIRALLATVPFVVLSACSGGDGSRMSQDETISADHAEQQHEALHRQNEARRAAQAWKQHQEREAWNKTHPEEVARRKEADRVRLVHEQQARAEAARAREVQQRIAAAQEVVKHAQEERESHPCDTAVALENQSVDANKSRRYQSTYDLAVSGLHYAEMCDNETGKTITKGYLLSFKGYAEHGLGSGDWRTDLNQANSLLVECQTTPGIYGTHTAAQCETQEYNNISSTTNWDINS